MVRICVDVNAATSSVLIAINWTVLRTAISNVEIAAACAVENEAICAVVSDAKFDEPKATMPVVVIVEICVVTDMVSFLPPLKKLLPH